MVKVTLAQPPEKELEFPILMEGSLGTVVLMTSQADGKGDGVVVVAGMGSAQHVGKHRVGWVLCKFKPFIGSITLEND